MTNGNPTIVMFTLEKETKGALRYQESDSVTGLPMKIEGGAKIGTLYVRKTALNGEMPEKLKVTIEAA